MTASNSKHGPTTAILREHIVHINISIGSSIRYIGFNFYCKILKIHSLVMESTIHFYFRIMSGLDYAELIQIDDRQD